MSKMEPGRSLRASKADGSLLCSALGWGGQGFTGHQGTSPQACHHVDGGNGGWEGASLLETKPEA